MYVRPSSLLALPNDFTANNYAMQQNFKTAMAKLAVVGQNKASLTDCSEVIPPPKFNNYNVPASIYPSGKRYNDLELTVRRTIANIWSTIILISLLVPEHTFQANAEGYTWCDDQHRQIHSKSIVSNHLPDITLI